MYWYLTSNIFVTQFNEKYFFLVGASVPKPGAPGCATVNSIKGVLFVLLKINTIYPYMYSIKCIVFKLVVGT